MRATFGALFVLAAALPLPGALGFVGAGTGIPGWCGRAAPGAARVCPPRARAPREHFGVPAHLRLVDAVERDEGGAGAGSEGASERSGAGVAVLTPDADKATAVEKKESVAYKGNWRVLLHRDEWYTFDYCEDWLIRVVPILTRKKAHRIAMQAHMTGTATVIVTPWKQLAREFSLGLLAGGFTSSIVPDRTNSS